MQSLPLAHKLDWGVQLLARRLARANGQQWTPEVVQQTQWPVAQSSMALGAAELTARVGILACLAQVLSTARAHLRELVLEATEADIVRVAPLGGAEESLAWIKWRDIELDVKGTIVHGKQPRLNQQ